MKIILTPASIILFITFSFAQNQRALMIGIDQYELPAGKIISDETGRIDFPNLTGCKNDVLAVKSVITTKYGFLESNIKELYDREASRKNILDAITQLLQKSGKGDIVFIFYAGHGSQIRNSKSREADKKDESIVPSDTWENGISDITDKELAKWFNEFLDKGVKLTVIFDCCHSGSMSRGPVFANPKTRYIAESNYDTKDESNPSPPEQRKEGNFLVMSASQDNELAQEDFDDNNIPHGSFTIALLQAIDQQPVDASVLHLFNSIRAILKSNGKRQEPVLGAPAERQKQTLFGMTKGVLPDKMLIPVLRKKNGKIEFQAGFAQNLNKENELTAVDKDGKTGRIDAIVVRIDTVLSINRSSGTVIKGNIDSIESGQLFEVSNWVSSGAPLLKLFIPPSAFSYEQVVKTASLNAQVRQSGKVKWINDLEKAEPGITIFFKSDKCFANVEGKKVSEIKDYSLTNLSKLAGSNKFYFNIPPDQELVSLIKARFSKSRNVIIVDNPDQANYILYGTIDKENKISYGWMRSQIAARDSLESMPVQTKYFALNNKNSESYEEVVDNLYEYAMRLSKVRGWLNLAGPKGVTAFPFHLALTNDATGKIVDPPAVKVGDLVSFHIVADSNYKKMKIAQKFVYVFVLDRNGNMTLVYPLEEGGNNDNKFPVFNDGKIAEDIIIYTGGEITEPVGTDSYFILASDEPIQNYAIVFDQKGVRGVETRGSESPLFNLINMGNENSRGGPVKSAANWNLIKLSVKTKH